MSAWVALPIISDPIIPPPPTDFRASRSRLPPASPKASKAPPAAKRPSAARRVMPVTEPSVQPLMLDDYRLIVAMEPIADYASRMAVPSAPKVREPKAIELLTFSYALGVAGTLWDWWEHLLGPGTQPPHLVIDLGGLHF